MSRVLVHGGTVVTATAEFRADVLVEDGRIAAVGRLAPEPVDEDIDAAGCFVLPGLVDNHTHLDMPSGSTATCDDFATGTAAAAIGGTTTIVDFAFQERGSLLRGLETWHAKAAARAYVDYGFHMAITDARPSAIAEMQACVDAGVGSFKAFMAYKGTLMVDDAALAAMLARTAETGGLVMVHAENGDAIAHAIADARRAGRRSPRYHALTRPPALEAEATGRAIRLAGHVGRPLYVVHVSCREALAEVQRARDDGSDVTAETCTHYLALTREALDRPGLEGAGFVCSPPLREEADHEALFAALRHRALEIVSSDHCPYNLDGQKSLGAEDFSLIPNGLPGIEHRLALLHELGVRRGRLTMPQLVSVAATRPAQVFGLAPHKGSLDPGADADIVIFDPDRESTLGRATHTMNVDYDPYEGWTVRGAPRVVLSRGEAIVRDGRLVASPGRGEYVARTAD